MVSWHDFQDMICKTKQNKTKQNKQTNKQKKQETKQNKKQEKHVYYNGEHK